MISLRWGSVVAVTADHGDRVDLLVDIDGEQVRAAAFPALSGPLQADDRVLLNTTAVDLGLGTGGVHLVVAPDRDVQVGAGGHAMKLRYSPLQVAVDAAEQDDQTLPSDLAGMPVVAAGLHSAVPAVAIGARAITPDARIAYVMTDGAALLLAFSDLVRAMRADGLLDLTITAGQATGGDLESVTLYSALIQARAAGADLAIVAMGPGNLGTGSRYGTAMMEVAGIADAAAALAGAPIVVPRISTSDARERHRGLSHHTVTALGLAHATVTVPIPADPTSLRDLVAPLGGRHRIAIEDIVSAERTLVESTLLRSMGRSFADDPEPFRVAAAAGVHAARIARAR